MSSALEHRVGGQLWTRVQQGELQLTSDASDLLARVDLRSQLKARRLWGAATQICARLDQLGAAALVAKGVVTERRWYSRLGERPCNDLDLMLSPSSIELVDDIVAALQPTHPLVGKAGSLMRRGVLQSIDLAVGDIEVDLHTDLLKYEIPTRHKGLMWDTSVLVRGPDNAQVRALAPELALVHMLLHLNKDNLARLSGYSDIARLLARAEPNWTLVDSFVVGEGLRVPIYSALYEVVDRLGLPAPPQPRPMGPRAVAWQRLWPPEKRLLGLEGLLTHEHRNLLLPWLAEGRLREAVQWWVRRRLLPPPSLLELYYPGQAGPYLWRLVTGRVRRTAQRHQRRRLVAGRRDSTATLPPSTAEYTTFPPKWANIHIPVSSKAAARAGLALYGPCLPTGLAVRAVAWGATGVLGPRLGLPGRSTQLRPPAPPEQWAALLTRWSADLGRIDDLVVHGRPQAGRTGFSVLLLRDDEPVAFVRTARDPASTAVELRVLRACEAAGELSFWYPRVLASGEVAGWSYLATTCFPTQLHRPLRRPVPEVHDDIRRALAAVPRPPGTPEHWEPMHGDFAPWNCRRVRGGIAIIDWEEGGWGPARADEVYLAATRAALFGSEPGSAPRETVEYWIERVAGRRRAEPGGGIGEAISAALSAMSQ